MTRILVVSVEPPWPAHHGGRLRVARVAEALSRDLDVLVTFPDHGQRDAEPPVDCRPLPWSPVTWIRSRVSPRPHLGGHFLIPVRESLLALCGEFRPETIYWSHSYLAAWSPRELRGTPHVVEFANIEGMRLRTLARSARGRQRAARAVEAAKAAAWEPRVARRASFCVALSEPDRDVLHGWGATAVLAPNGVDTLPYLPSPADGYALALASYDYGPNVEAVRHLVRDVWPLVRRRAPAARLVVAGRGSEPLRDEFHAVDGVSVAGSLDDVSEAYANAAVSLAPATTGGGSQLKLTESLSRGRCVVMTPFGASGLPAALRASDAYRVADHGQPFADAIVEFLDSTTVRHARERSGWQSCQSLAWSQSVAPVVEAIGLVSTAGSRP